MSKTTLKKGNPIPKESISQKLPNGVTLVDSLEISKTNDLYEIQYDFNNDTQKRIAELVERCKPDIEVLPYNPIPQKVSIIIPSDKLLYLNAEESKRATPFIDPSTNIILRPPRLIRFIDERYVEEFFSSGKLMLSSFNKCRKLENELRQDINEGIVNLIGKTDRYTYVTEFGVGDNPLMLCSSSFMSSPDEIRQSDGSEAGKHGIIINQPDQFIVQIISSLGSQGLHVYKALFGPCHYSDRVLSKRLENNPVLLHNDSFDFEAALNMAQTIAGDNIYFEKSTIFRHEVEWRFVFLCNNNTFENLIIHIENPEQLCSRYSSE